MAKIGWKEVLESAKILEDPTGLRPPTISWPKGKKPPRDGDNSSENRVGPDDQKKRSRNSLILRLTK